MPLTKNKDDVLIRKLQETAEYWFLKGLENDVTPHVMGQLPDLVEAERQRCYDSGILKEKVDNVINNAWRLAYTKYHIKKLHKSL